MRRPARAGHRARLVGAGHRRRRAAAGGRRDPDQLLIDDDLPDHLDPAREWKLRAWAIPCALGLALAFNLSPTGHMLQRTFLTMIPHELGHAITAWWSGYAALPTLWRTMIPDEPSTLVMIVVAAGELGLAALGWRTGRPRLVVVAGGLAVAQFFALTAEPDATQVAITFGGDAGAMVLGALLMLAFFAPEGSKLRAGALRWGLLAIGAAAFVDVAMTWWRARSDHAAIPFGQIEGVGDSDPSKLLTAGWSPSTIVDHYLAVAGVCLAVVLAVWAHQTWRMRARASQTAGPASTGR